MADYKYKPKFIPGPPPCVIKSYSLTRGRVLAGGAAWRNKFIGQHTINIQSAWFTNTLSSGQPVGALVPTSDQASVNSVRVIVTGPDQDNVEQINTYWAEQNYNNGGGDPLLAFWTSAIPALRTLINNNDPILSIPVEDVQLPFAPTDQGVNLGEFNTDTISTGEALPTAPAKIAKIRTGFIFSLINIIESETETIDNGALTVIGQVFEWNGFRWVPLD